MTKINLLSTETATRNFYRGLFAVGLVLLFTACDRDYLPKPVGYNRLELPEPAYRLLPDTLP